MLSIGNLPPDPSCPCEISQLIGSDDRASGKLALQEVDLPKSGLDDNSTVLPKFSIRDYVFGARRKDIKTNWPFSQKNLQFCLNHEVADLLPPFQPAGIVRDQSVERCAVETSLCHRDAGSCWPSDELVSVTSDDTECNENLGKDYVNIINSECEEGEKFPSTTTSQSHSGINSIPVDKGPSLGLETNTLPEALATKVEAAVPPAFQKTESIHLPVKKCRLIVKLSKVPDQSSTEDISANNYLVSETMASKVCPVCKIFSSSSNTTLNAHIDQCLSGDSTTKWKDNCKEIKHRIKPRKMKLMTDIYSTAQHCTLEELDRRNGTSWATNSTLVAQELEVCAEEKKKTVSSTNVEDTGSDSAVYIDANGTKLRILSKFNDVDSVSEVRGAVGPGKPVKGSKGSKFLSTKKKKKHVQKHYKFLKLVSHGKEFCSSKPHHNYKIFVGQERNFATEKCAGEERIAQHIKAQELKKLSELGTLRRWVCSKRTSQTRKSNVKDGHRLSGYDVTPDLPNESVQSTFGDTCVAKRRTPNKSMNLISSLKSNKKMQNSLCKHRVDFWERPLLRKRMGFSLQGSRVGDEGNSSLLLSKQNRKQLRNEHCSMYGSCKGYPPLTEENVSLLGCKTVEMNSGSAKNPDDLVIRPEPSLGDHTFSSKGKRFASLKSNLLVVCNRSVPQSKTHLKRKFSALQKSRVHFLSGFNEEAAAFQYEGGSQHALNESPNGIEEITDKVSVGRTSAPKITKKRRGIMISKREKTICSKSPQSRLQCYGGDVWEDLDSSVRVDVVMADKFDGTDSAGKDVRACDQDIDVEPASTMAIQGCYRSLSKSLDAEIHELASPCNAQCDSQQHVGLYKEPFCGAETSLCPTLESLGDAQEMFCSNEVGNDLAGQNNPIGAEVESKYAQGNYYSEVDPIPIPGPPGSYLPSPGGTDSEDLQGNSSLTTSRVQSFEDQRELVDKDSSDSPFSVTSTISNSALERSDLKPSVMMSAGHRAVQGDHVMENSELAMRAMGPGAETFNLDGQKVDVIFSENVSLNDKNDLPCCCSHKEGAFPQPALNHQKPQLLSRTMMTSVPQSSIEKQMTCDPNKRISNLNLRSELFYARNHPIYEPGKVVLPAMKSPAGHNPMKVSADSDVKFQIHGDCDSASPSSSVLRLMGKNLMVVNKDEDVQTQFPQVQTSIMDDHPHSLFCTVSGVPPDRIRSDGYHSFNHVPSQAPMIFGQNQHNEVAQCFDVRISYSSGNLVNFKTLQSAPHVSGVMFHGKNTAGGFTISSEQHEYQDGCSLPTVLCRPKSSQETQLTYNMEKNMRVPASECRSANSTSSPTKDIVIIDDIPHSEVDLATEKGMIRSQSFSVGTSIPMPVGCNVRQLNPLYSCQPQEFSSYARSTRTHDANFQKPASKGVSGGPVNWHCTQEGSLLHSSSLTTPRTSTGHLRSALHYSPN